MYRCTKFLLAKVRTVRSEEQLTDCRCPMLLIAKHGKVGGHDVSPKVMGLGVTSDPSLQLKQVTSHVERHHWFVKLNCREVQACSLKSIIDEIFFLQEKYAQFYPSWIKLASSKFDSKERRPITKPSLNTFASSNVKEEFSETKNESPPEVVVLPSAKN